MDVDTLPEECDAHEDAEVDCELGMLREQIAMLTKQFYQDRQQWLEEKRRLQEAAKQQQAASDSAQAQRTPSARHGQQRVSSSMLLYSEAGSEVNGEDASQGGMSAREPTSSSFTSSCQSTRSASPTSPSQTDGVMAVSASGQHADLVMTLAEMQRQLQESRRQQESAAVRWTLEREALQRQVHALINMSAEAAAMDSGGRTREQQEQHDRQTGDDAAEGQGGTEEREQLNERVSELEAMVEELQDERVQLEEQLLMLAADATRAKRATHSFSESVPATPTAEPRSPPASGSPAEEPSAPTSGADKPPEPQKEQQQAQQKRDSGDGQRGWALTLTDSVNVPALVAAKAQLERELRRYREEFVAVPRAEYSELSSVRQQMVFMEGEMQQLRQEAEEAVRLREAAEEQLSQVYQECVTLPHDEYQRLLRQAAEARAKEAVSAIEGAAQSTIALPVEEHRRLLAAVQERDALAEHVTALQLKSAGSGAPSESLPDGTLGSEEASVESGVLVLREQLADAVEAAVAESSRLGARVQQLEEELERMRHENAALVAESGVVRSALASGKLQANDSVRAAAVAADEARNAAVGERSEAQRRVAILEDELVAAHKAAAVAWAERDSLLLEMAAVRDAAVRTTEALADCQGRREAAELAASAATADLAAATQELVSTKMELAEARELEVLFRRDVFKSKRMLHGLPQEWIYGAVAAAGPGSGPGSRVGSRTGSAGGGSERMTSRFPSESFASASASGTEVDSSEAPMDAISEGGHEAPAEAVGEAGQEAPAV